MHAHTLTHSLCSHKCEATHDSNTNIKFADDMTVVGLITGNNETTYREEVSDLSLNVSKTKELIVGYRKQGGYHAPIHIDGAAVERIKSFKFLVSTHTNCRGTTAPLPHQDVDIFWHGSSNPKKVIQLHH